jgi:hypothetical protein
VKAVSWKMKGIRRNANYTHLQYELHLGLIKELQGIIKHEFIKNHRPPTGRCVFIECPYILNSLLPTIRTKIL